MNNKMKVFLIKEDGSSQVISVKNELPELQKLVGGYIETVTLNTDIVLVCDEEGLLKEKKQNPALKDIAGDFFLCGIDGDEFRGLTDREIQLVKRLFKR